MVERNMEKQEFELLENWLRALNRRLDPDQRKRLQDVFGACPGPLAGAETPHTTKSPQ